MRSNSTTKPHLSARDLRTWAALERDYIHFYELPSWAIEIMWKVFVENYGTQQRSIYTMDTTNNCDKNTAILK